MLWHSVVNFRPPSPDHFLVFHSCLFQVRLEGLSVGKAPFERAPQAYTYVHLLLTGSSRSEAAHSNCKRWNWLTAFIETLLFFFSLRLTVILSNCHFKFCQFPVKVNSRRLSLRIFILVGYVFTSEIRAIEILIYRWI